MRDENQFFSWVIQMNYLMQEQTANEQVAFIQMKSILNARQWQRQLKNGAGGSLVSQTGGIKSSKVGLHSQV